MPLFPIFLKIEDCKCVVVGAGKIATAKAAGLLRSGARVVVIGPRATQWIRKQARAGKLQLHAREFTDHDISGALLVVAATSSSVINEAVFRACRTHGVLCNVVDDPEHCDFFYSSLVRRGPLQIAISTAGTSPALARRLRQELEQQFGPEYKAWLEHLGKLRKQVLRQRLSADDRKRLMQRMSSSQALADFIADHTSRRQTPTKASARSRALRH